MHPFRGQLAEMFVSGRTSVVSVVFQVHPLL